MGLLKVTEFAEKYEVLRNNIYTYQKRGKVIIDNGMIDENHPINKVFIECRKISLRVKESKPKTKKTIVDNSKQESEPKKRLIRYKDDETIQSFKKSIDLKDQKLQEEIRLAKIRNDKIEGRLISVDLVKKTLGEIISRYKINFVQRTEQLIRDTMNELLAENTKITLACSKLTDIANESSDIAITETKIAIQSIVEENSNK